MIPAGYMYKPVTRGIYSVGACGAGISPYFTDYVPHWKHNGYWFFDTPQVIREIAQQTNIDLSAMTLFYYEIHEYEFEQTNGPNKVTGWAAFQPDPDFATSVLVPETKTFVGYDVVEYTLRSHPECSLLSCSDLASKFKVNPHCLFHSFEEARVALESGEFHACEPGPYRILSVYCLE